MLTSSSESRLFLLLSLLRLTDCFLRTERPSAFTHRTAADTRTYLVVGNLDGGEQTPEEVIAEFSQLLVSNLDRAMLPLFPSAIPLTILSLLQPAPFPL